jgi:hypothetical protein
MFDHSRAVRLGHRTTGETESALASRLAAHGVSVAIDAGIPGTLTTGKVLLSTLARLPGGLSLDRGTLSRREIETLLGAVAEIHPDRTVEVRGARPAELRVDVGPGMRGGIHGVPVGHGYRIGWSTLARCHSGPPVSGLGSVSAAAALAGEVFKVAAGVTGIRGQLPRSRSFCPVSLTARPEDGPDLPEGWHLEGALAGVGAIGTGIALILSFLPIGGALLLIDRQMIAIENLGTYSLGGLADVEASRQKTAVAARVLSNFSTCCFDGDVAALPARIDAGLERWPRTILAGLDSPEARRDLQQVWPDLLIDGATGDTMAGLHEIVGPGQPCMECLFPPTIRSSAAEALASATGLPVDIAAQGSLLLRHEHLDGLAPDRQDRLRPYVGREICGLARPFGLTDLDDEDYQPAVPFVSLTAATLVVGRLIARAVGRRPRTNVAQFDVLAGPQLISRMHRRAVAGCRCEVRRSTIATVRALRDRAAAAAATSSSAVSRGAT